MTLLPDQRYWLIRYVALTIALVAPLIWAFVGIRQWYPIPAWSLFSEYAPITEGRTFFILRGERADGTVIDIPAISITDALQQRNHTMVSYVMDNASFELESPHPDNAALLAKHGNVLLPGARVAELLRGWGAGYNLRVSSEDRLAAIRLDEYHWPGGKFEGFDEFVRSWRCEL
jgi:hypothetical protein